MIKDKLLEAIKEELGENPSPKAVLDMLYKNGVITDRTARPFVIHWMHWKVYKTTDRSSGDIDKDIAAMFDGLSDGAVSVIRRRFFRRSRANSTRTVTPTVK